MDQGERLGRIEEKLSHIEETLSEVRLAVCGPKGLHIRVDRLENSNRFKNKVLWFLFTTVMGLAGTFAGKYW